MGKTILISTGLVDHPHSIFPHRRDISPANLTTALANGYTKVLVAYSGYYYEYEGDRWWKKHPHDWEEPRAVKNIE
jgi:hypothetical protein